MYISHNAQQIVAELTTQSARIMELNELDHECNYRIVFNVYSLDAGWVHYIEHLTIESIEYSSICKALIVTGEIGL